MPDQKSQVKDPKARSLLRQSRALNGMADRLIANIDPTYNDRRILSEADAKIQKAIDRQLDLVKGVSETQIVDTLATIRANQKRRMTGGRSGRVGASAVNATDLFTENIGDIFGYFQDVYKNRYVEVEDLKFISKFIPAIAEGVRIYMDSIVASDDVSQEITRSLNIPGAGSDDVQVKAITDSIEQLEKEHQLQAKLKVAYKKALITGTFYAYHIAYKDLFEMYDKGYRNNRLHPRGVKFMNGQVAPEPPSTGHDAPFGMMGASGPSAKKRNVLNIAHESQGANPVLENGLIPDGDMRGSYRLYDISEEAALESLGPEGPYLAQQGLIRKCQYKDTMSGCFDVIRSLCREKPAMESNLDPTMPVVVGQKKGTGKADRLIKAIENDLPDIYFVDAPVPFEVLQESFGIANEGYTEFFNDSKAIGDLYKKKAKEKGSGLEPADGTYDLNGVQSGSSRGGDFSSITGTYIKWIDYKYMIPVEILGRKIGYYHIITTTRRRNQRSTNTLGTTTGEIGSVLSSGSMSMFNQLDVPERRKEEAIQNIVDTISSAIMDQFSARFVKKNANLKKIIAECVIANGIVDNDYMIQFIPAENVVEFKCNIGENGKGQSILADAMFPAHQLLSFTACKMLNYINKGGNKTIAHISSGRVNRNTANHMNRVIRDIQSSNVTFTDLLSSGTVFSKITRDSNMAMPKDSQGNRLVEFEIQEGQQIDLTTDYEEMLQNWVLIGMGIPPTFMDYIGNTEAARKIVSDNITIAGRVASLQADLEKPTTELYRAIIEDSDMSDDAKAKASLLDFKLPRPRILMNQNNADAINTALQNAQAEAELYAGQSATDEDTMRRKDIFVRIRVQQQLPYINWAPCDEAWEQAGILLTKEKVEKERDAAVAGSSGDGMGGGMSDFGGGEEDFGGDEEDLSGEDNLAPEEGGENPETEEEEEPSDEVTYRDPKNPDGVDLGGLDFPD